MKTTLKRQGVLFIAALLLAGCGGGGGGTGGTGGTGGGSVQPGALETGGAGLPIAQVVDATGSTVTANFSSAVAINSEGVVVGLAEVTAGSPFVAALWSVNSTGDASVAPTPLASLVNGGFAAAFAIDEAGSAVGQADNGTNLVAVIWTTPTTPAALPAPPNSGASAAYAISLDGTLVAGEAVVGGSTRAVLWSATGSAFVTPPTLLPVNIFANGSTLSPFNSASGVARVGSQEILVVGEVERGNGNLHAALWRSVDAGASFSAVDLGNDYVAYAVNGNRRVVGESDSDQAPVAWDISDQGVASAPISLGPAGSAVAINSNSRIAGWTGATTSLASVWLGNTPTALFASQSQAYGINNEAQPLVVGRNGNAGFVKRAD